MTIFKGLLNTETLKIKNVFKDSETGAPEAPRMGGLNPKFLLVDCDAFGNCPTAVEDVRELMRPR